MMYVRKRRVFPNELLRKKISHDDYSDCLFSGKEQYRIVNVIRSHKHTVYSERVNKICLSSQDDKR